jgi:hypothetical protein
VTITLPPPPYARQGGEVIASQLAKIGINAKLQNVEWAQWLSNTYGGAHNYDMTIISHVEPFDLGNFAKPDYYWGYDSKKFNDTVREYKTTANAKDRSRSCWATSSAAGRRQRARLPVPAAVGDGGQQERQGPVEGHADLRERPVRHVLA